MSISIEQAIDEFDQKKAAYGAIKKRNAFCDRVFIVFFVPLMIAMVVLAIVDAFIVSFPLWTNIMNIPLGILGIVISLFVVFYVYLKFYYELKSDDAIYDACMLQKKVISFFVEANKAGSNIDLATIDRISTIVG